MHRKVGRKKSPYEVHMNSLDSLGFGWFEDWTVHSLESLGPEWFRVWMV